MCGCTDLPAGLTAIRKASQNGSRSVCGVSRKSPGAGRTAALPRPSDLVWHHGFGEQGVKVSGIDVSVVVPYYNDQSRLTLLLRALAQQQGDLSFDVVVADDGSTEPPIVASGLGYSCSVVRQPDRGFRAAAARNLGAEAASGELLLFLDGDTLPSSSYLTTMVSTLRATADGRGALVLGRRRHADLAPLDDDAALAFLRADPAPAQPGQITVRAAVRLLDDPRWLLDGYARTDNLRAATDEDFRLVISAVLGVDRQLWAATGGFDGTFVGYGGEDWDFGWRAWLAGAQWRYQPAAIAWHDGPDAAGRGTAVAAKNVECLRLAETIPLPSVRGTGLVLDQPEIVVRYLGPTTGTVTDAPVVACVGALLAKADAAVWFPHCSSDEGSPSALPPLLRRDPRVHAGEVPPAILDRARYQVRVTRPLRLPASLDRCCAQGEWEIPGLLGIRRTRAIRRGDPAPTGVPPARGAAPAVQVIPESVSLERWWAGW